MFLSEEYIGLYPNTRFHYFQTRSCCCSKEHEGPQNMQATI